MITNIIYLWKPAVEIIILWVMIYYILLFFVGTRALQVLRGIIFLLIAFLFFQRFDFMVLDWLLTKLFGISVIAMLVIFQPEIRQGLARLGQRNLFSATLRDEDIDSMLREIGRAVEALARDKIGALIAIEKKDPLSIYTQSGIMIDSKVSSELIQAVFTPNNPLHDGGLIIQHGRVMAAGCLFPLNQNQELSRIFGTRHRAALGLSEESDAIVLVVSEERQDFSLVYEGKLHKDLSREDLITRIKEVMKERKNA